MKTTPDKTVQGGGVFMLDEVLLKRLKTIHECGSFARAAEQLFVSRQALVEQVSMLEKQIKFPLFSRSNRGTFLTLAGKTYLENSLQIVSSYQQLLRKCREQNAGANSITIGSLSNLPGVTLPKICQEYSKLHPEVKFHFEDYPLRYFFDQFRNRSIDITSEYIMNYYHNVDDLLFLPMKKIRQHIGVLQGSPLARKRKLGFSDLRGRSLIMYREGIGKAEDRLRAYIRKNEPDIRLIDIESYDSSLITKCMLEDAVVLLYTTRSYPALISIPAAWDITIELGIGYHRNPDFEVQELLALAEDMNKRIDLF